MAILSVRLPKDIEKALPRKQRSVWVIDALRKKIVSDRALILGLAAAEHAEAHLKELELWEGVGVPREAIPREATRRRGKKR